MPDPGLFWAFFVRILVRIGANFRLGTRGFGLGIAGFSVGGALGVLTWDPTGFVPRVPVLLFLGGLGIGLVVTGYLVAKTFLHATTERPDRRPFMFEVLSAAFLGSFFAVFFLGPNFIPWAALDVALFPLLALPTGRYFIRHMGGKGNERPKMGLAAGFIVALPPGGHTGGVEGTRVRSQYGSSHSMWFFSSGSIVGRPLDGTFGPEWDS